MMPQNAMQDFLPSDHSASTPAAQSEHLYALLHTVMTYVPRFLGEYALRHGTLPSPRFCEGSVLFADVSGFTHLSERLRQSDLARESAEVITNAVNEYFDRITAQAARHGGSVLKFGGDAALLFFEGADHALRACLTALTIQQTLLASPLTVEVEGETIPLSMSMGIGSGTLFLDLLGDEKKRELAILGPALQRMGRAESLAHAGEIVVDATTAARVKHLLPVEPHSKNERYAILLSSGEMPSLPTETPELDWHTALPTHDMGAKIDWLLKRLRLLTPFLPYGLLDRLKLSPTVVEALDEVRWATVLFAEMPGIDAIVADFEAYRDAPERLSEILNGYFVCMSECVRRYEGIVNKLSVSPTGLQVMATFGAPRAHEDDPQRAVLAALNMLSSVREQSLRHAWPDTWLHGIGVNTGFVFAGNVGGRRRREYTVMGDEVNTAYRVMSVAAPNTVVLTDASMRYVRQNIVVWPLEERYVKGKRKPLSLYRAIGPKSGGMEWRWELPLVNRKAELQAFDAAMDAVLDGRGQFLHVEGEAGVGKSRLIGEIIRRAGQRGLVTISTICLSYSRETPYMPWNDILRTLLELPAHNPQQVLRAALADVGVEEWAPLVGEMLQIPIPETPLTASLSPQLRQQRLFDAVWRLLQAHIPPPGLVIFIEDAQWADSASLELLEFIAPQIGEQPLLLCAIHRPRPDLVARWRAWGTHIPLQPLNSDDIAQLMAHILHAADVPEELRTLIYRKSQGNPLFAQELVRAFQESGMIQREGGALHFVSPFDEQVPDTIHRLLQSRIDRLPEEERRVLQTAACIGQTFTLDVLQAIYPHDHVHRSLGNLVARGLLFNESFSATPTYTFAHTLTQEVAHQSLSFSRRRSLHRQIADTLERTQRADTLNAAVLAYHFYEGEVWEKAAQYAFQAAKAAQHEYANETAIAMYRRALQALDHLEPLSDEFRQMRLDVLMALGTTLSLVGEYDEALALFEEAQVAATDFPPDTQHAIRATLALYTAEVFERRGEFETALQWVEQGLQDAAKDPADLTYARLLRLGAGIYHRMGQNETARAWCERCLAALAESPHPDRQRTQAHVLFLMAEIVRRQGHLEEATTLAQQSAQMYEALEDVVGLSQVFNTLGNIFFDMGDLEQATHFYNQGMKLKEKVGDVYGVGVLANNLGEVYLYRGDLEQAEVAYRRSMHIWQQLDSAFGIAVLHNNLAVVATRQERWQEALMHLAESERLFIEINTEDWLVEVYRHKVEMLLGMQRLDVAYAIALAALELARMHAMDLEEGIVRRLLGDIAVQREEPAVARHHFQSSLEILRAVDSPHELAHTHLALARWHRRWGDRASAEAHFDEAERLYRQVGAVADVERLHQFRFSWQKE
nr:tetratricopeptide repeat protein [Ardenticatena sp.]